MWYFANSHTKCKQEAKKQIIKMVVSEGRKLLLRLEVTRVGVAFVFVFVFVVVKVADLTSS